MKFSGTKRAISQANNSFPFQVESVLNQTASIHIDLSEDEKSPQVS